MKTDVYSWRVSRARKAVLQNAARAERTSVAKLLDRATDDWIQGHHLRVGADPQEQARLHRAAMRFVGTLRAGDPRRSRQVRIRVKASLTRRRAS